MLELYNNKTNKILIRISGDNARFTIEHQSVNLSIFFFSILYLISFPQNSIANLPFELDVANAIALLCLVILYGISRKCILQFNAILIIYLTIFIINFSIAWFFNGGIAGGIPFFYMGLISYLIFITKGRYRIIFPAIILLNVLTLLIIEFLSPNLIIHYKDKWSQFEDIFISFVTSITPIALLVFAAKKLYLQEKKNTKDIIEQYRKQSIMLKSTIEDRLNDLTFREKEVFQLIIEGKSNKDIADKLSLSLGSVKNHVTSIYKKVEVEKRADLRKHNNIQNNSMQENFLK